MALRAENNMLPLTSVRFAAAFAVVIYHTLPRSFVSSAGVLKVVDSGFAAVGLFFILSGFILARVYPSFSDFGEVRTFWVARVARIYPVYLVSLLADVPRLVIFRLGKYGLLFAVIKTGANLGFQMVMLQALFLSTAALNHPSWSVATEAFFYLAFPFIAPRIATLSPAGRSYLLGINIIIPILACWSVPADADWLTLEMQQNPFFRVSEFIAGVVLASYRGRFSGASWVLAGVLGVIAITQAAAASKPLLNALLSPFFAMIIFGLASTRGTIQRLMSLPILVLLGEASYSMYLIHVPMWYGFEWLGGRDNPGDYAAYIAATVGASIAMHALIERPCRAWIRKRWARAR